MEAEAREVGRYIEKLSEEISRFRRTGELSGEFVEVAIPSFIQGISTGSA